MRDETLSREEPAAERPLEEPAAERPFPGAQTWPQQAHRTALLRFDQEQALGRVLAHARAGTTARGGDDRSVERARQTLILANMGLVASAARQYQSDAFGFEDLVQEGAIGLIQAVDRFDYRRGYRFSTYALWWIRQAMLRAMAERNGMIRVPAPVQSEARRLQRTRQSLGNRLGRTPSYEELAQSAGVSEEKVSQLLAAARLPLSLDMPAGKEQDARLGDMIPAPETSDPFVQATRQSVSRSLQAALQILSQQEQELLVMRYGLDGEEPRTLEELSRAWKRSRERLRQMEIHALQKLRRCSPLKSLAPGASSFA